MNDPHAGQPLRAPALLYQRHARLMKQACVPLPAMALGGRDDSTRGWATSSGRARAVSVAKDASLRGPQCYCQRSSRRARHELGLVATQRRERHGIANGKLGVATRTFGESRGGRTADALSNPIHRQSAAQTRRTQLMVSAVRCSCCVRDYAASTSVAVCPARRHRCKKSTQRSFRPQHVASTASDLATAARAKCYARRKSQARSAVGAGAGDAPL